jgi:hypothetical protein
MLPNNFPLEGDALRGWLNSAGQAFLLEFESGQAAIDFARSQGMSIRTSDFYAIYNNVWDRFTQNTGLVDIPGNQLIPLGDTITTHGWELSDNFLYRFRMDGVDPETGEPVTLFRAINSNRQLTVDEAAGILDSMETGEDTSDQIIQTSYTLDGAYARPGLF